MNFASFFSTAFVSSLSTDSNFVGVSKSGVDYRYRKNVLFSLAVAIIIDGEKELGVNLNTRILIKGSQIAIIAPDAMAFN